MSVRKEIKRLLVEKDITLSELARLISEKKGQRVSVQSLSNKLGNETISYVEIKLIAEILGYKVEFVNDKK